MEQASSALQVIIAALLAALAAVVTAFITSSWDNTLITSVTLSTFLGGLLTPYLANALTTRKKRAVSRPRQEHASATIAIEEVRTLYVGNLPFKTDEETINELFSQYGQVQAVRLVKDRRTGRKKGYGFVEIDANAADAALAQLNDSEFEGRTIKVRAAHSEAEPDNDDE
ncbi:RNA recognition motif domain-containing protein [Aliidiomarina quisquiliarum]|uniref:RNA recognition motif domain-containing protein n=1 Tax=Aliidiomarina quisquiliarum TaxID=2938947 RepID=UPI00208E42CA|nr:RNA-binding protein [Aliidiomarina quisquiliarum]MCO4321182.1 RNA-binding protein [Aliidiomarina quisquiliarum]